MKRQARKVPVPVADQEGLDSLVLATDFSPGADGAVQRVALLPLRTGAQVTLLHVLPRRVNRATDSLVRSGAQQRMDHVQEWLLGLLADRNRGDVRVKCRLIRGNASEEIGRLAEQADAELVVLGRRGTPVLRNLLLGSVAQRVARHARVPVLVVAKAARVPYQQVVLGFDFSPDAELAAALMGRMVLPEAQVAAVHAYREVLGGPLGPSSTRRVAAAELAATRQRIQEALPDLPGRANGWVVATERGDPRQVLLDAATARKADLIAVGSMGRTGLRRELIGSVAEGVLQLAATDVLVTPRPLGGPGD